MNCDDIFNECDKLPEPLTKKETYELFRKIYAGDKWAKETLAHHNIKLVLNQVTKKFCNTNYEQRELVEVGCIGLVKAINTFDISKNIGFSTYAIPCIDNEIKNFIKANKKVNTRSLNELVVTGNKEKSETLEDTISDGFMIDEHYSEKELKKTLNRVVEELPERERAVINLYFGLKNNRPLILEDVAKEISYSRSYTAVLVDKTLSMIAIRLRQQGFLEGNLTKYEKIKIKTKN